MRAQNAKQSARSLLTSAFHSKAPDTVLILSSSIEVLGFVCTVDLFPVTRLTKDRRKMQHQPFLSPATPHMQQFSHSPGTVPPPQYISSSAARSETDTLVRFVSQLRSGRSSHYSREINSHLLIRRHTNMNHQNTATM